MVNRLEREKLMLENRAKMGKSRYVFKYDINYNNFWSLAFQTWKISLTEFDQLDIGSHLKLHL